VVKVICLDSNFLLLLAANVNAPEVFVGVREGTSISDLFFELGDMNLQIKKSRKKKNKKECKSDRLIRLTFVIII
jgi:hypothetical protein